MVFIPCSQAGPPPGTHSPGTAPSFPPWPPCARHLQKSHRSSTGTLPYSVSTRHEFALTCHPLVLAATAVFRQHVGRAPEAHGPCQITDNKEQKSGKQEAQCQDDGMATEERVTGALPACVDGFRSHLGLPGLRESANLHVLLFLCQSRSLLPVLLFFPGCHVWP